MKILLTAATVFELEGILDLNSFDASVSTLVTGVGMTATAFSLGKHLANNSYDLVLNVGIAGAFNYELELGEVVEIANDQFSELGAEDDESFLSLVDMGLAAPNDFPFTNSVLNARHNVTHSLKKVQGITVNKVHGSESSIQKVVERLKPDVESMEGAAFLYSCLMNNQDCMQIRAISNYVEKRNRNAWQIELALSNLAQELKQILS